jgi:hypothetical protein
VRSGGGGVGVEGMREGREEGRRRSRRRRRGGENVKY